VKTTIELERASMRLRFSRGIQRAIEAGKKGYGSYYKEIGRQIKEKLAQEAKKMAKINIDDTWWVSPRRSALIRILGSEEMADGAAVKLWRLTQDYCKQGSKIPKECFDLLTCASALLACGLAVEMGDWIHVRGASSLDAEITAQAAVSSDSKDSKDSKVKIKIQSSPIRFEYPEEFSQLWEIYNRKGDKKESYEVFKKLNLSGDEIAQLTQAIQNYKLRQPEDQYRKDFQRYLKTDWREDLKERAQPLRLEFKTKQQLQHDANDAFFKKKMAELAQTEAPDDPKFADENSLWTF